MLYPALYLKRDKDRLARSRHLWLFSGAFDARRTEAKEAGPVVVCDSRGAPFGVGTFNPRSELAVRLFDFAERPLDGVFFRERFSAAKRLRERVVDDETNAMRLVHGEGDGLPGMVIDTLAGHLVAQIGTPGLLGLEAQWLDALGEVFEPRSLFFKPDQGLANREKMEPPRGQRLGTTPERIEIRECGQRFIVDVSGGQKTGFFFDQRDNRRRIAELSAGARVLDAFCYTGGFAVQALAGGAREVLAVDSSEAAVDLARQNVELAGGSGRGRVEQGDVRELLGAGEEAYDLVILDPPAFAKRRQHVERATSAYRELFAAGFERLAPGGLALCCSCSAAIDAALFDRIVAGAARITGRFARVVERNGAAADHPVSPHHPEGNYLKAWLVAID